MRLDWARKERHEPSSAALGPLRGAALQRLQRMPTPTLVEWIDGSVTKVGVLVQESQRREAPEALELALEETAALLQALEELLRRS